MHLFNAAISSPYLKDMRDTIEYVFFCSFKTKQNDSVHLHNQNTFLKKIEVVFFIYFIYTLSLNIYIYICIYIEAIYRSSILYQLF